MSDKGTVIYESYGWKKPKAIMIEGSVEEDKREIKRRHLLSIVEKADYLREAVTVTSRCDAYFKLSRESHVTIDVRINCKTKKKIGPIRIEHYS